MSTPLTLTFGANTDQARNAIAQLASTVVTNMLTIGSAMKTAADHAGKFQTGLQALPTILRGAAAGFIAFEAAKLSLEAVSAAAEAAREKLKEIVDVANNARNVGVGTNFFQEWTHQADALYVSAERLVAMLQHARDATTVTLGTGGNASASPMQALLSQHVAAGNIGAGDLGAFNSLDTQEARIKAILDLIDRLRASGKELAALNIGQAMFGAEFANQLRNGVDLVGKMRESLTNIQDVKFPPDIVEKAKQLDEQLKAAQETMERGWAPVQQDILRWQQTMLQNVADMKTLFADIVGILGQWYTAVKGVGKAIEDLGNASIFKSLNETLDKYGLIDRNLVQHLTPEQVAAATAAQNGEARPLTVRPDRSNPLPAKAKTATESADEVDTYIKSLQKAVEVLEAENRTYGQSNTVKAEAVDFEKALAAARTRGTPLTDAEREAVKRLADQEGAAKDKAEQLTKATEGANARATFLGDQAVSAIERIGQSGVRAKDIVLDFAKALEKAALQAALLGTGPLAQLFGTGGSGGNAGGLFGGLFGGGGMFGSLFGSSGSQGTAITAANSISGPAGLYGPGFASGGMVGRDGTPSFIPLSALRTARHFDTGGGIPAILHPGEIVLNAGQQKNVAAGLGSGGAVVHYSPTINGSDLTKEQLLTVLNEHGRQIINKVQRNFGPMQADYVRRHG